MNLAVPASRSRDPIKGTRRGPTTRAMVCTPGTRHRRTGRCERRPAGLPSCTGRLHASGTVHVLRAGPPIAVLIGPVPRRPGESCDAAARVIRCDRMGQTGPTSHSQRAASHSPFTRPVAATTSVGTRARHPALGLCLVPPTTAAHCATSHADWATRLSSLRTTHSALSARSAPTETRLC
ncbi:unnamed protein product [Ixodes pacificus]